MNYVMKLVKTASTTGYFDVVPHDDIKFENAVKILNNRPYDSFLHRYVLNCLKDFNDKQISTLIKKAKKDGDLVLQSIACERILLSGSLVKAEKFFSEKKIKALKRKSPLINIRSATGNNKRLHSKWVALFRENIVFHRELPLSDATVLPLICTGECSVKREPGLSVEDLHHKYQGNSRPINFSIEKTIETALCCLKNAGVILKQEMRHESSLSPFALLRQWKFDIDVENSRNVFHLSGEQTSYGKGLTLEHARVSLTMEIVERCSAFASVNSSGVDGFVKEYPLFYGSYRDIVSKNNMAVNPDELAMEIQYGNEPLYWMEGETTGEKIRQDEVIVKRDTSTGEDVALFNNNSTDRNRFNDKLKERCEKKDKNTLKKIFVPVQSVFLFSNLDEVDLFSGIGSTGFASGNTMEQAKVAALLEIIERHQEAVVPFEISRCFRLVVEDREKNRDLAVLLESCYSLGIDLLFQDITPEYGVPCCKCFVTGTDGTIYKGTAAGLNAKKAIISAITETNYPFPNSPVSEKGPDNLIIVGFENLPDYSTGDYSSDLALLEHVLVSNGFCPSYIDLTRKDIGLPVVKAVIPGMDIIGDFDEFSRVHPELFQNYLKLNSKL